MKTATIFYILFIFTYLPVMAQNPEQERLAAWARQDTLCDLKNMYRLNDEVYRSEQPSRKEFICLEKGGIESILNLREKNIDGRRADKLDVNLYHVQMRAGSFTTADVVAALRMIKTAHKPVLIHCMHGSDRTGLICAMYRIVFQDWPKEKAIDELENGGYGFHKKFKNIPNYIRQIDIESIKKETGTF
jgi:tyrosine-protein phosphatase SIW14